MNPTRNIALLVDVENQSHPDQLTALLKELDRAGSVVEKRAIANWSSPSTNKSISWSDLGFKLVSQTGHLPGRNAADFRLVIEAIEMAHDASLDIDTFAVVSSDFGFIPLYTRLRQLGKTVIVAGNGTLNNPKLEATTDRIINLRNLTANEANKAKPRPIAVSPTTQPKPKRYRPKNNSDVMVKKGLMTQAQAKRTRNTIRRALRHLYKRKKKNRKKKRALENMYRALRHVDRNFSVRKLGYTRLHDLLLAFPEAVIVNDNGESKPTVSRIALPPKNQRKTKAKIQARDGEN